MHRFEDRRPLADVRTRRHAEPADQPRDLIGEDVAEEVGSDDQVELPGVEHELHRARIDDPIIGLHPALVLLRHLFCGLEKDPGQRFQHIRLVHDGDFLATVLHRVVERILGDAARTRAGVHAGGDGDGVRIAADRNVVLEGDVETFEVFTHQDDVDVVVTTAGNDGARWAQVGVEPEGFAQPHVYRTKAAADGGGERSFERELRAANAFEQSGGQRIAGFLRCRHAALLSLPLERRSERSENLDHRRGNLRPDAVARNQGRGNAALLSRHSDSPSLIEPQSIEVFGSLTLRFAATRRKIGGTINTAR